MNKEPYTKAQLTITMFEAQDVICGSPTIEVKPPQDGGGVISDP